jgi:hypothetical protein
MQSSPCRYQDQRTILNRATLSLMQSPCVWNGDIWVDSQPGEWPPGDFHTKSATHFETVPLNGTHGDTGSLLPSHRHSFSRVQRVIPGDMQESWFAAPSISVQIILHRQSIGRTNQTTTFERSLNKQAVFSESLIVQ